MGGVDYYVEILRSKVGGAVIAIFLVAPTFKSQLPSADGTLGCLSCRYSDVGLTTFG